MKNSLGFIAAAIFSAAIFSPADIPAKTMNLQGISYRVDTIEHYKAGPAMTYSRIAVRSEANTFGASVLEIDMTATDRPCIKVEPGCDSVKTSERVTDVARRKSDSTRRYVAAMNGDFFITSSFAANHPLGMQILGYPNVTSATCGKIISPDAIDYDSREKCFILTTDGKMYIDATNLSYSVKLEDGNAICMNNVNYPRGKGETIIYNSFYGRSTRTDNTGSEVIVELAEGETWGINRPMRFKVIDTARMTGNSPIPVNGAVISAADGIDAFDACNTGDELSIAINLSLPAHGDIMPANISEIIGGDVRILKQGTVTKAGDPDAIRFINPAMVKYQRSLIGFSQDCSKLVFCSVDNGIGDGGVSYYDAGDLMRELGCHDALDLDGGGSTLMYLREPGIVNHLRDGVERAVGNGIYAVVEAPEDNAVSTIRFADTAPRLARHATYRPTFYGYNHNGELISMNVQGVKLCAPSALGEILGDGTLRVTGDGCHRLTATYNNSTISVAVKVEADTE